MQFRLGPILCGMILFASAVARSQESTALLVADKVILHQALTSSDALQDAPAPREDALANYQEPTQGSSSSQATTAQSDTEKTRHEKAKEQLKEQEHQRLAGVMATFNTTSNKQALPLSPGQKFRLFFKSSTDPWPFLLAGVVAGIGQADDSYPVWGQGMQGYAKRYGAAYSDSFIGNFF